jgi:hypothetical protein
MKKLIKWPFGPLIRKNRIASKLDRSDQKFVGVVLNASPF